MRKWSKEIWSSVTAVILFVLLVVGLINDVPTAIATMAAKGPEILTHPNTYWIVFVLLIEGVVLHWIWRGAHPRREDNREFYETLLSSFSHSPSRVRRIASLWASLGTFYDAVHACRSDRINANYVFSRLELVYPPRVKEALGIDASRQFVARARAAKHAGPVIAVDAAIVPILDLAWQAIEEEMNSQKRSGSQPAAVLQPPDARASAPANQPLVF